MRLWINHSLIFYQLFTKLSAQLYGTYRLSPDLIEIIPNDSIDINKIKKAILYIIRLSKTAAKENIISFKWSGLEKFHLLLGNPSTSEFLKSIWKRARKFQGVPTGITQNVEDLLQSSDARAIINNSSFIYMLNQSQMDRAMLKELLNLSENDMEYVTNVDKGHGLIKTENRVVPFEDKFPANTRLFKIMDTKPQDDAQ